ncbi:hypothetical protein [Gelidibacter japonicus]|uniref:hypothetical protein n=1 Tax=Gelidibacter japonicus TaxID=1962232 RepID=UPI003A94BB42
MNNILNKNSLIIIYFIILVLADITTKMWNDLSPAPSYIIKGLLLIPVFIFVFRKERRFLINFTILLLIFSIGCLTHSIGFFLKQMPQFFEYYTFVFFFIFFYSSEWPKIRKPLEWVFLGHVIVIFIAALFEIKFLKTYPYSDRYGYISFFKSQNEFSYILMAGVLFFYNELKKTDYLGYLKLSIFISSGLMVGTKAFFLFLIIFFIYILFNKMSFIRFIFIILGFVFLFFIFSNPILHVFKENYSDLYIIYMNDGFLSFISSQRSELFWQRFDDYWASNNYINLFFGGSNVNRIFEMSFVDLFAFFGVVGVCGYIMILYCFFYKKVQINFKVKIIISIIVLISFFAGYLLENASAQTYLLLVILCTSSKTDSVCIS